VSRHPIAVTTRANPAPPDVAQASAVAERWGVPRLDRPTRGPLSGLLVLTETVLVVERASVSLWDEQGSARWSLGLAALRLRALDRGEQGEALVDLGALVPGESVLDCTLGLAQDARVAARLVGPGGRVVGLEVSLPLAMLASEGLRLEAGDARSAGIEVRRADARTTLAGLAPGAFDVILFDPMFSRERKAQPSFALLRRLADPGRLEAETLAHARRVARRLVLVKAPRHGPELKALGLRPERASRSAPVVWARLGGSP
jgi:16S rRNA (guanine1516-N2)-methyltransferase